MANKADEHSILASKLDLLIRLQAYGLVSGFSSQKEKIIFLARVGMQPKEIGEILGISANSVSVTMLKARKAEKINSAAAEKPTSVAAADE
jgi:DNA-directed RNA polymerase specialized sigma24 family protein